MTEQTRAGSTRTRLLDAAEELLATVPYRSLSVRAVCAAAGTNPASVHYHFGSKEALVSALLQDRFETVWADPLDALEAHPRTVADIVAAILDPLVALHADPTTAPTVRVLAEFVIGSPGARWSSRWFRLAQWTDLLIDTVDGLDIGTEQHRWRYAFTVLMTELAQPRELTPESVAALRDFLTAGLAGPSKGLR